MRNAIATAFVLITIIFTVIVIVKLVPIITFVFNFIIGLA